MREASTSMNGGAVCPIGERSWLRKGQEAIITWMLEDTLSKQRILELYLNVAEWGDGVFGAEAAARHHFGIGAAALNAEQAAWWARIGSEPDFEAVEQSLLLYAAKEGRMPIAKPYRLLFRDFVGETRRRIVRRLQMCYFLLAGRGSRIDAARAFKGLGPRR